MTMFIIPFTFGISVVNKLCIDYFFMVYSVGHFRKLKISMKLKVQLAKLEVV